MNFSTLKNSAISTNEPLSEELKTLFKQIVLPASDSHKGQNGKLMIIGGSALFHAASKWSLDTASRFVDMVFYSSIPSNNHLILEAKQNFWNGIVVPRENLADYINEADCILIGPGMERTTETQEITNSLLKKYADKKWVIDAGALQMVDPNLINENCILTPHSRELEFLLKNSGLTLHEILSKTKATILLKGPIDQVFYQAQQHQLQTQQQRQPQPQQAEKAEQERQQHSHPGQQKITIAGGNVGMTKGGTGDVLAGLIAGLYCTSDAATSTIVGSFINKKAGDSLFEKVGPFFNASDLCTEIPATLWKTLKNRA